MKVPDKVRIGSMDYKVIHTDNPVILDHRECKGMIDYEKHVITLKNGIQDDQGKEETFLHELIHGIVNERNFDMNSTDIELKTDELAKGLHQVIKDNPKLFN